MDPAAVVKAALQALNDHDLDAFYAWCEPDLLYVGSELARGVDEARAIDEPFFTVVPDHWRRVERILTSGDTVAAWLRFGGTPTTNGRPFEIDLCDVFEVRSGRIATLRMIADWDALRAALA